jgi:flagellar hook-associated protein 2
VVLRISGFASGLDTDQIIKDLMKAHRIPVDQMKQKKTRLEWQRDAYKEINSKLLEFRNNTLFNLKKESTFTAKTTTVTGNTSALTAKATTTALDGTLTIQVLRKATAASNKSTADPAVTGDTSDIRANTNFDAAKPLTEQAANLDYFNAAANKFTINGKEITIEVGDSLNSIIGKINKNTNVTAYYDSFTGEVSLVSKNTGKVNGASGDQAKIAVSGEFLEKTLKLRNDSANNADGKNASVIINGITTERASNTFDVNGVSLTLFAEGGAATTIEVKTDVDAIVSSITSFIESYNDINSTLYDRLNEPKYRDFPPLTEDQKKDLSDEEIDLWEEKARSGLLRRDSLLEQVFNRMRYDAGGVVSNGSKYNLLSAIGIETGEYSEHGKLVLKDEAKLRKAIEEAPGAVLSLFTADGNGDDDKSDVGIMERMYKNLQSTLKDISDKAGTSAFADTASFKEDSVMGKQLKDMNKRIDDMLDRLAEIENRYYRQFTAMETAMQRFNNQSAFLANQFGTGM